MASICVYVAGGLVQAVYADDKSIEVTVVDNDDFREDQEEYVKELVEDGVLVWDDELEKDPNYVTVNPKRWPYEIF